MTNPPYTVPQNHCLLKLFYFLHFCHQVDTVAPSILSCPNNVTTQVDPGNFGTIVSWRGPEIQDASGDVMLLVQTHAPGTFFTVGSTIVSYIYRDYANNMAKCSFFVTVIRGKTFLWVYLVINDN